ncbi:MAG: hypothetical protein J6Y37_06040, partial [Paludibacteraceae bacterium]|nr:hypothetical protein [Paludibacteraceae bacterium]
DILDLLTPSCIAISSEFCAGDVTHRYTYYPGCGCKGIANVLSVIGLCKCVWKKTVENHDNNNDSLKDEDRTEARNSGDELYNCIESELAEDNDACSYNFQNDWINGTLYAPMWFRKITPKKRFLFGLIKKRAKDEWCSASQTFINSTRLYEPCSLNRKVGKSYNNFRGGQTYPYYVQGNLNCGNDCHEKVNEVYIDYGLIVYRETMFGQPVYYYKPVEYSDNTDGRYLSDNGRRDTLKLHFASDIVLLGSLNDCDLDGVPQFFKSLESTTYKLPTNVLFADNYVMRDYDEDGNPVLSYSSVSTSEMAGCDWGNSNEDICDGQSGLFYDIGCSTIKMAPKSCINLSRVCEFGTSLDETKQVPDLTQNNDSDTSEMIYDTLVLDGFISKDELYNDDERSMFATMNGNSLRTTVNQVTGMRKYDFRHIYVDNYDKSLYEIMKSSQRSCSGMTQQYNYHLEDFSQGYYDFRMGEYPHYYVSGNSGNEVFFPRYENSFYFYFGLKVGKTAIDRFNSEFFSECLNAGEAVDSIKVETKGNNWCLDQSETQRNGYVALDLSNVTLPCDILIQNANSSGPDSPGVEVEANTDERIYFSISDVESLQNLGYVKKQILNSYGIPFMLPNGTYDVVITDSDGEIITSSFTMSAPILRYSMDYSPFREAMNVLEQMSPTNTLWNISDNDTNADGSGWSHMPSRITSMVNDQYMRNIGGSIAVYNVVDTYDNTRMASYCIEVKSMEAIEGWGNTHNSDHAQQSTTEYDGYYHQHVLINNNNVTPDSFSGANNPIRPYRIITSDGNVRGLLFGVPKGNMTYEITVTQICGTAHTNNKFTQRVTIKEATPFKLFINSTIDYDVIKSWGCGMSAKGTLSSPSISGPDSSFNMNWLNIGSAEYNWSEYSHYENFVESVKRSLLNITNASNYIPSDVTITHIDLDYITDAVRFYPRKNSVEPGQSGYHDTVDDVYETIDTVIDYLNGEIPDYDNGQTLRSVDHIGITEVISYYEELLTLYDELVSDYDAHSAQASNDFDRIINAISAICSQTSWSGYTESYQITPGGQTYYTGPVVLKRDELMSLAASGDQIEISNKRMEISNGVVTMDGYLSDFDSSISDLISAYEILKDVITGFNERQSNFVDEMRSTFQLTCQYDTKDISFTTTTDDRPVTYYLVYRPEDAVDDASYNTLSRNVMSYQSQSIRGITIPTITSKNSELYGNNTYGITGTNVCYATDNRSKLNDKLRKAFFVAVKNAGDKTIPNDSNISAGSGQPLNFFGFHVIDKIFSMNTLTWGCVQGIPFYGLPNTDEHVGKKIIMSGFFTGFIYNGLTDSVDD